MGEKKCLPCQGGVPPLEPKQCRELLDQLHSRWYLNNRADRLLCSLGVSDPFRDAPYLFREFGALSEYENHHPELRWFRGRLDIEIWTHKIHGLVESDFILAAKMDTILSQSGMETKAFPTACYEEMPLVHSEMYQGWCIYPRNNVYFRRFSFANFKIPWEYTLKLLDPSKGFYGKKLGIGLGFGHLEVRMDGLQERSIIDKVNQLIKL